MEDAVYLCGWEQTSSGFKLWTKSRPRVSSEGETYELAAERLIEAIQNAGGAMVPVFEFVPPLPETPLETKYGTPEIYTLSFAESFETELPGRTPFESREESVARLSWFDDFFERPVCRTCGHATSPRSERNLPLTYVPSRYDGAFGHFGGQFLYLVADEFLALLSDEERAHLVLRPVVRKRARKRFHEVLGPGGPPLVAAADVPPQGWRCDACGYSTWACLRADFPIDRFVAAADLPDPLPSFFTIGSPPAVRMCVTGARWRELVGRKGARGCLSQRLGVASDADLVRRPDLPAR